MSHDFHGESNKTSRAFTGDAVVSDALRGAARHADAISQTLPPVNVPAILAEAAGQPAKRHPAGLHPTAGRPPTNRPAIVRTWLPRAAAAAACMAAALAALVLTRPAPLPQSDVPAYVAELVNELYDDGDYVHDQISPFLFSTDTTDDGYLDDVWASVIQESSDTNPAE